MTPPIKRTDNRSRVVRGGGWATPVALTLLGFRTTQKLTRPITKVRF